MIIIQEITNLLAIIFILFEIYALIYSNKIDRFQNYFINNKTNEETNTLRFKIYKAANECYIIWVILGLFFSDKWQIFLAILFLGLLFNFIVINKKLISITGIILLLIILLL